MKHAFLIMAHTNYPQLDRLIRSLDSENVDIYLHIDLKSPEYELPSTDYSKLIKVPGMKISWGGYSQVKCELSLLDHAVKGTYDYYHLLTGQDILLKPIEEVKFFFERNSMYNFVHFDVPEKSEGRYERIRYFRLFQNSMPHRRSIKSFLQNKLMVPVQRLLRINRTKRYPEISFKSGSAFYSIKNELAEYILTQRQQIDKWFHATISGDEMFVQTLLYNSEFRGSLYDKNYDDDCRGNQRLIDWKRGTPYTWQKEDYNELMESGMMFARKFDSRIDNEIIDKIYNETCHHI